MDDDLVGTGRRDVTNEEKVTAGAITSLEAMLLYALASKLLPEKELQTYIMIWRRSAQEHLTIRYPDMANQLPRILDTVEQNIRQMIGTVTTVQSQLNT